MRGGLLDVGRALGCGEGRWMAADAMAAVGLHERSHSLHSPDGSKVK